MVRLLGRGGRRNGAGLAADKANLPAAAEGPVDLDQAERDLATGLGVLVLLLHQRLLEHIDPVPLEPPDKAPPPKELERLHFNEWTLAYRKGSA